MIPALRVNPLFVSGRAADTEIQNDPHSYLETLIEHNLLGALDDFAYTLFQQGMGSPV